MQRVKINGHAPKSQRGGNYFPSLAEGVDCIPTGCALLDCVLGGGWARRRIVNIVGDRSTGKTLLGIEACANFAQIEPKGKIFYREAEAAFDEAYAESLGLPVKRVDFGPEGLDTVWDTVEDIFEDLDAKLAECEKNKTPGLYIVDSLDALTSRAELGRKPGEATFGLEKQKMMGKLFRQLTRRIKSANMCVMIISQVRDKIGVVFGEKHTRTGGKALDFYASQILWVSHIQKLTRTVGNVKRVTGVRIKALCKKNKVSASFRDCEFVLRFGYGIDDFGAALEWLTENKAEKALLDNLKPGSYMDYVYGLGGQELLAERARVHELVVAKWQEIEGTFAPKRKKYG